MKVSGVHNEQCKEDGRLEFYLKDQPFNGSAVKIFQPFFGMKYLIKTKSA